MYVLQWVRSQGCLWDERTPAYAAASGHLALLQWVRSQGPWDEMTTENAAFNGNRSGSKGESCPWNKRTCASAAASGHCEIGRCCSGPRSEGYRDDCKCRCLWPLKIFALSQESGLSLGCKNVYFCRSEWLLGYAAVVQGW
jgi:hypothetical protein